MHKEGGDSRDSIYMNTIRQPSCPSAIGSPRLSGSMDTRLTSEMVSPSGWFRFAPKVCTKTSPRLFESVSPEAQPETSLAKVISYCPVATF